MKVITLILVKVLTLILNKNLRKKEKIDLMFYIKI